MLSHLLSIFFCCACMLIAVTALPPPPAHCSQLVLPEPAVVLNACANFTPSHSEITARLSRVEVLSASVYANASCHPMYRALSEVEIINLAS